MSNPAETELWKKQTQAQRLSNRTILRFQGLADEFKNDLSRILPDEEKVKDVLFVSADRTTGRFDQSSKRRFYNARLLRTFRFIGNTEAAWRWIKQCCDPKAGNEWKENLEGFKQLFGQSQWSEFERAVTQDSRVDAHNMLINAIARLPYTGFLPSVFDDYAFKKGWCNRERLTLCRVEASFDEHKRPVAKLSEFESRRVIDGKRDIEIDAKGRLDAKEEALGKLYFPKFIDHFVNGRECFADPSGHPEGPYNIPEKKEILKGFFLPVYDFNDEKGSPAGGFEGWLIVETETKDLAPITRLFRHISGGGKCHNLFLKAIRQAVQSFASRVGEERMRELEEEEWTGSTTPESFTRQNYQKFGGWENEPDFNISLPDDEVAFAFYCAGNTAGKLATPKLLLAPCDQEDSDEVPFEFWKESDGKWGKDNDKTYDASIIENITHIAVRTELDRTDNPIFLFKRRLDTLLPSTYEYLNNYGFFVARSVKDLYKAANLREKERTKSQQTGFLTSAHDYSKDVGTACLKMMEFNETLRRGREAISRHAKRLVESPQSVTRLATEIESELSLLDAPRMEWFANVRFTYAHLQTQTTGALAGEPPECIAMLEEGTVQSINKLVDHLVWLPLDYGGYKEIEDSLRKNGKLEKQHHLQHPQTWASLFRYDMVPAAATSPFHERLGRRIGELILEEEISEQDFFDRFLPPEIKIVTGSQSVVEPNKLASLWLPSGEDGVRRWTPLDGLLPLFVFSLRFAFQCAWGKTLLHALREAECIHISPSRPFARSYRLTISFSSPSPETRRLDDLPYYVEWQRQISHYTDRTFPWSVGGTDPVTLVPEDGRIQVSLTASI